MIYVRINGGLGNQLFRYAAGRALAERNRAPLVLDLSWYRVEQTPPRRFVLDKLKVAGRLATWWEKIGLNQARNAPGRIARAIQLLPTFFPKLRHIKNDRMEFQPEIYNAQGDLYLDTDCQSERYFKNIEPLLREELTLKSPTIFFSETKKKMEECNSVALHIRRGDYVWNPKVTNGTMPLSYYEEAADFIASKAHSPTFFVFSDDLSWAKENLKIPYQMEFVTHPTDARDWEELFLMAACKHQIIANSSFSWWGAWLNQNPAKTVCAPKRWFADESKNTRDVVPAEWQRF